MDRQIEEKNTELDLGWEENWEYKAGDDLYPTRITAPTAAGPIVEVAVCWISGRALDEVSSFSFDTVRI
ncbi:hypothetical protein B296_00001538 [Ensete ventricosum]|uniref:Uncharacterized protein n=1 Tax=Ensete ventricosum TaxID=4639 RepID=A0A426ZGZ3_ENSVE|nr:hypothetical protein B296_00001538 [Ensete ventricosum]